MKTSYKNRMVNYVGAIALFGLLCSSTFVSKKDKHPGEVLYKKFQCIACHGSKGTSPFNLTDSKREYTYDNLKNYIDNPASFGNTRMPSFKATISESEYKDLIGYIMKLKKEAEQDK